MTESSTRRPRAILVGMAAVAAVAGVVALYAAGDRIGNSGPDRCAGSAGLAQRLKPLAAGDLAALIVAETPADVADLVYTRPDGTAGGLADHAGSAVLLNLWATWCAPCRAEMPALDRLQAAAGGDGFEVVTVNIDVGDPAKPAAFLATAGITRLPDNRDPKMAIFETLKSRGLAFGMPTTLVVDKIGCQVAALHGPAEWDSEPAKALAALMAAAP